MSALRRILAVFLAVAHITATGMMAMPSAALAQASDGEPPTISFERIGEGVLGDTQVFSASVTDDRELATVTLHYRLGESSDYESALMRPIAGTAIHSASVETRGSDETVLQYYIEARDAAGNRSIQGFAFDPIERALISPEQPASAAIAATAVEPAQQVSTNSMSTGRKVLYGILGIVVVGAIASAAGDSGGSRDNPAADDPGTVPVRILVDAL